MNMRQFRQHRMAVVGLVLALGLNLGCSSSKKSAATDSDDTNGNTDSSGETEESTDSQDLPDTATNSDTGTVEVTPEIQNQTVFAANQMLEYHITIEEALLADMDANGNDEEFREAALRVVGDGVDQSFEKVGFRYKGAWSLHHCWDEFGGVRSYEGNCARLSSKIKFNEYDDNARFYGLKRLNLHSMMGDPTKLRERLSYSLYNDFGVIAPRTAHAKLFINGQMAGLVMAVEPIDGRFTHFRFPEGGDGNLYKEVWPSTAVSESWALEQLETNDKAADNPDVSDMLSFVDAIGQTSIDNFEASMQGWIDIENLLRYIAVDRAIRNWDGIMGFYSAETSHNFYWYHDNGPANIFHLIPWDLDNTMGEFDLYMDPQGWCSGTPIPDWNEKPQDCSLRTTCISAEPMMTPPRCDHLIDMLALTQWERFSLLGNELLSDVFTAGSMKAKIDQWAAQIAPAVAEDPLVDAAQWEVDVERFGRIIEDAINDFQSHLSEGLIEEVIPTARDENLLNDPIVAGGLRVDIVNNFEIPSGTEQGLDDYLYGFASDGTEISYVWNTESAILGNADLQMNVDFLSTDGPWSEWAGYFFATPEVTDVSGYSSMWFSARASADTRLRMAFHSDAYAKYGDIGEFFLQEFSLSSTAQFYRVDLKKLQYPDWAKDSWGADEGWSIADAIVLNDVLSNLTGITLEILATTDPAGDMISSTESVSVHIDNLYFE